MESSAKFAGFVAAQDPVYDRVIRELRAGHKTTHWMWFIFPQLAGLGSSHMAQRFALSSEDEARAYSEHAILGQRLRECTDIMLALPLRDIDAILGYPDNLKFRSSMTLFAAAVPEEPIFELTLQKFFAGQHDPLTLELLGKVE
jgi:uncharacterized protein (DUF1810 family)